MAKKTTDERRKLLISGQVQKHLYKVAVETYAGTVFGAQETTDELQAAFVVNVLEAGQVIKTVAQRQHVEREIRGMLDYLMRLVEEALAEPVVLDDEEVVALRAAVQALLPLFGDPPPADTAEGHSLLQAPLAVPPWVNG